MKRDLEPALKCGWTHAKG